MTNLLLTLAFEFFKVGLFAVGGGLAAVPFLAEMSERYGWFTIEDLSTMIAVSESTPGPIGINMATYVGFDLAGIIGALIATLSVAIPSLIIVCIIANCLERFREAKIVKEIFAGLKPAVVAFIISACLSLFLSTLLHTENSFGLTFFNFKNIIIFLALLLLTNYFKKIHPIAVIVIAGVCGVVFGL